MKAIICFFASIMFTAMAYGRSMATPENSANFRKYVEPNTRVVSYILDSVFPGYNHQSLYFTQKSMTDDERFLVFQISGKETNGRKHIAVYDFMLDKPRYRSDVTFNNSGRSVDTAYLKISKKTAVADAKREKNKKKRIFFKKQLAKL